MVPGVNPIKMERGMMDRIGYFWRIVALYADRGGSLAFDTIPIQIFGKVFDIGGKPVASFRSAEEPNQKFEMILPPMRLGYADDNLHVGNATPEDPEKRKVFNFYLCVFFWGGGWTNSHGFCGVHVAIPTWSRG